MEPRTSPALTSVGIGALRRAAVMAHTVGTISLRLTAGGAAIVDVRPDPAAHPSCGRVVDPCGFRIAVARAWADHEMGREVALIGHGPSDALEIAWSVAPPGHDLGFGAVRSACGGRVVWAFATVLEPTDVSAVLADMGSDGDDIVAIASDGIAARLVHDDLLGATIVHVEADGTSAFTRAAPTRVLDEVLRRMVAVVGAAELAMELT